jgi:hypothetical protein
LSENREPGKIFEPEKDITESFIKLTTLTACCGGLLGRIMHSQIVKKFPAFYGSENLLPRKKQTANYPKP